MKKVNKKLKAETVYVVCIAILIAGAALFAYSGKMFGNQAVGAMYPDVIFSGQFKIGDGAWEPYIQNKHIPANKGDVTLKGKFELISPADGENLGLPAPDSYIACYLNHIGGEISEDGGEKHFFDTELPIAGEEMCGEMCIGYRYKGGEEITIVLRNPHRFGNERAVDDFLDNLSIYGGTAYENDMQNRGNLHRTTGMVLMLASFVILGISLFSVLINMKIGKNLLPIGSAMFFAGVYLIFSARGVMYWSEVIKFNTRVLCLSIIFYMFFTTLFVAVYSRKKIAKIVVIVNGVIDALLLSVAYFTDIKIFDVLGYWVIFQSVVCVLMTAVLIHCFVSDRKNEEIVYAFGMLPMISFVVDAACTRAGFWQGGYISAIVVVVFFLAAVIMLLRVIPKNINATARARDLEAEKKVLKAELADSRIAILISQIQPHFIYNTLGTIEQLCKSDPEAASSLVHDFSLYLRGNFSELDNSRPIRFSKEMEHVKHYTDIEQVRFPDMTIMYDLRSVEFVLPALSVQPLVENAIKHGLMGLEEGGIVTISAYEKDDFYVVEVSDDGVGYDMEAGYDETKHVGIKNIRGRIEAMCNGTLTIHSKPGEGTRATLKIPKEAGRPE